MRRFEKNALLRLAGLRGGNPLLSVFPGRSPVHMAIRVGLVNPATGRIHCRYRYIGKWSYAAYKRGLRTFHSLDPRLRRSSLQEFTPTMVLYTGDIEQGQHHKLRNRLFYSSAHNDDQRATHFGLYRAAPAYPIRTGGRVIMCLDPKVKDADAFRQQALRVACLNNFKAALGGLHYDL